MISTQAPEPAKSAADRAPRRALNVSIASLLVSLAIFTVLAAYQLDLPGLHYDEAKEAGVNAMQLLTGQPVTAFRGAAVTIGRWQIPLMVQDYIGSLNVVLAVPFLAIGGINVVALRALPIALALLTLLMAWKIAARLGGPPAAAVTALLLAVSPSFVFWSRQGIFVTNITVLLFLVALWFGILWWQGRRSVHLILTGLFCGLGVYAKLLFVWAVVAMVLVALILWLLQRRSTGGLQLSGGTELPESPVLRDRARRLPRAGMILAAVAFVIPLLPLVAFNLRTGGTLISVFGNLGHSYYGVDNSAYAANLGVRLEQVLTLLKGSQFWYLGEIKADALAPYLLLALVLLALASWLAARRRGPFTPLLPLVLVVFIVLQSAFTVSDLFVTHFAMLVPLFSLAAGLAVGIMWRQEPGHHTTLSRSLGVLGLLLALGWVGLDAQTTVRYHRILTIAGGYASHSDAIYHLADYLDSQNYATPAALDWGIDAPVEFLTAGRVNPIDVFGYDRIDAPDPGFAARMAPYVEDWLTIYVGHAPEATVFKGRVDTILSWAADGGMRWLEQTRFGLRSGAPVFIVYRLLH